MIDGDCLAAFVAIARERNFSRAADKLGIVQSVVSKRLRRLEDQLGTQLVDRSVRSDIHLNRAGNLFLPEAIETLARLDRTERTGRNLGRGSSGPLRIGFVFSSAMNGSVAKLLKGLRSELPELQFQPQLMETPEQLAALDARRLDLALVRPRPSYPDGCRAFEIHSEGLVVCLSAAHPMARYARLTPHQLAGERFIIPQFHEKIGLVDSVRKLAHDGRFELPPTIRTDDFVTATCLAAAGDGIVLVPASLARVDLDGVVYRDLSNFDERLANMLVYRLDGPERAIRTTLSIFGINYEN